MSEQPSLAGKIVDLLNTAFAADPAAIHALCCNRIPCNQALADHPSIVVDSMRQNGVDHFVVGLIGVLNGLCWDSEDDELVAIKFDDNGQGCVGFCVVDQFAVDDRQVP